MKLALYKYAIIIIIIIIIVGTILYILEQAYNSLDSTSQKL